MSSVDAPRILVLDDNVEFATLLGTLLAEQGLAPVLAHTAREGLGHLEAAPVAAILLDLLLPDMTGHRLLEQLARRPGLPPVHVMSGVFKGGTQHERVAAIHPIAGWYEKPFDTRLLVEALVRATGGEPKNRKAHQAVGDITGEFDINILEPVDPVEADALHAIDSDDIEISVEVSETFEAKTELSEVPADAPPPTPFDGVATGFGLAHSPSPSEVSAGLRTSLRSGSLATTTMPRLLNAFFVAQETGEIAFERGHVRKLVYFDHGRPVYAFSNQESDRLGAIAKRVAGLSDAQLEEVLARARATEAMTGDVLVDLGYVDGAGRAELLAHQTRSIIRSLFTWDAGRYVIGFRVRTDLEPSLMPEETADLVIRGVRELFELDRIRRHLPGSLRPQPSPNPPFQLYELPLGDPEAALVLRATGVETVDGLVATMAPRLEERRVRAELYSLLTLGVLVAAP